MKKLITTLVILIISIFAVGSTAFAETKTELPVVIKHSSGTHKGEVRIDSFKVDRIVLNSYGELVVQYKIEYTELSGKSPKWYVVASCYDEQGQKIYTNDYLTNSTIMLIPKNTATIRIESSEPTSDSQSYLYQEYVNVYAPDGREKRITKLQVPAYESVGWSDGITLYALDENGKFTRTKKVPPLEVEKYKKVGWYTYADVVAYNTKKELPVTIKHNNATGAGSVRIDSFKVKSISKTDNKELRIDYEFKYTKISGTYPEGYIAVKCYDDRGQKIKTIDLNPYSTSMTVPLNTERIKFDSKKPAEDNQAYVYREYVNVYAPDGRVKQITKLQVPTYESVGWKSPVTMYAPDANGAFTRTKQVSPFRITEYEKVGWYTYESATFSEVKRKCKKYIAEGKYDSVFPKVEGALAILKGTKYENELYSIRTEAMDKWRSSIGKPMGVIGYSVGENSIGTPEVSIQFRNLSYKKIVAYKVKFTCYNVFGEVEKSYYDTFYDDDANIGVAKTGWATWTLYGADSVKTVKNIRVVEVVFEDGTKWK